MYAMSLPGFGELVIILFFIGYIYFIVSAARHAARNDKLDANVKLFWIFLIVMAPLIGALVYYALSDYPLKRDQE